MQTQPNKQTSEFKAFGARSVTTVVESPAKKLGAAALGIWDYLAGLFGLLYATLITALAMRRRGLRVWTQVFVNQVRFTGVNALWPVTFASLAIGAMILIQGILYLPPDITVPISVMILVREVAPVLTALILIGRSGTAIAIEIGNMKLNQELDALRSMGIPLEHVVALPRVLGMVVSFCALFVYSAIASVVGGYLVARAAAVAPVTFTLESLLAALTVGHFTIAMLKVLCFGLIVGLTSIEHGLSVQYSVREIPIVTTRAVVRSMLMCIVVNSFIAIYM
jgi:phospholipid/cholesterol/gamma-HCH transport system permease protein